MKKSDWQKLFAHEAIRLTMFAIVAFFLWQWFKSRKTPDDAKAAVSTAASVASGMPPL